MGQERIRTMTLGNPWVQIIVFALPLMGGNLLQQLYSTVDMIIVGRVEGDFALAAVGASGSLIALFTALSIGLSIGAGVIIAQNYGAGKMEEVEKYATHILKLSLGMGGILSILGAQLAPFLMENLLHTLDSLLTDAVLYFRIYALGLVFQFVYNGLAGILRSLGNSRATFYILCLASLLNIGLDLVFVGRLGWGVLGAGWATMLSQAFSCMAILWYVTKMDGRLLRYKGKKKDSGNPSHEESSLHPWTWKQRGLQNEFYTSTWHIGKIGMPIALQQIAVAWGGLLLQRLMNTFSEDVVSALVIVIRLEHWIYIPIVGLQTAMATYTSQNMGANNIPRIRIGVRYTLITSIGITACMSLLLFFFGEQVIEQIASGAGVRAIALENLKFLTFSVLCFGAYFPLNGVLQGMGESLRGAGYAMLSLGLRVAFAYLFASWEEIGYRGIWLSQGLAWLITMIVYFLYYYKGLSKKHGLQSR